MTNGRYVAKWLHLFHWIKVYPPYLQYGKGSRLSRSRPLELGQPVPGLPGVPADFVEERLHVPVNEIPVGRRVSVGETSRPLVLGQSHAVSSRPGGDSAHGPRLRTELLPPPLTAGAPGHRRGGQVPSRLYHGSTTGGAAGHFGHVAGSAAGCWQLPVGGEEVSHTLLSWRFSRFIWRGY